MSEVGVREDIALTRAHVAFPPLGEVPIRRSVATDATETTIFRHKSQPYGLMPTRGVDKVIVLPDHVGLHIREVG